MKILKFVLLVLIVSQLYGCFSPEKKLEKLQKKHPYLFLNSKKDTFIINPKIDTVYFYSRSSDTIYRYDSVNNIRETLFYFHDTLREYYKARPCTSIVETKLLPAPKTAPKAAPKVKEIEEKSDLYKFFYYIIVILVLSIILTILWKVLK